MIKRINDYKKGDKILDMEFISRIKGSDRKIYVKCFCGKKFSPNIYNIKNGRTSSCGCIKFNKSINATKNNISKQEKYTKIKLILLDIGKTYGKLTYIKDIDNNKGLFRCECGKELIKYKAQIFKGLGLHCGCMYIKSDPIKLKLSNIYGSMVNRCTKEANQYYNRYGGRGIKVIWNNATEFIDDMIGTYKEGLQIDRIDNDGNYCKDNCRWVTSKENSNNTSRTVRYKGIPITKYCDDNGLNIRTVRRRIYRLGWSIERSIEEPLHIKNTNLIYK